MWNAAPPMTDASTDSGDSLDDRAAHFVQRFDAQQA
jgi:hypothetical protein